MTMHRWGLALAMLSVSPPGHAKCALNPVEVAGVIVSRDGAPLANTAVAVAWQERGRVRGPTIGFTNDACEFNVRFGFNTYSRSGAWFADVCKGRLESVVLGVAHPAGGTHIVPACVGGDGTVNVPRIVMPDSPAGNAFDPPACGDR